MELAIKELPVSLQEQNALVKIQSLFKRLPAVPFKGIFFSFIFFKLSSILAADRFSAFAIFEKHE